MERLWVAMVTADVLLRRLLLLSKGEENVSNLIVNSLPSLHLASISSKLTKAGWRPELSTRGCKARQTARKEFLKLASLLLSFSIFSTFKI